MQLRQFVLADPGIIDASHWTIIDAKQEQEIILNNALRIIDERCALYQKVQQTEGSQESSFTNKIKPSNENRKPPQI